jgi:flagellar basal body-associated protein FliL
MKNRSLLIGIAILIVGLIAAVFIFTSISNRPDAGTGQTEVDNVSAGTPEVTPEAVGGEAPEQPQPSQ